MKICIGCSETFVPTKSDQEHCNKNCWTRTWNKAHRQEMMEWKRKDKLANPRKYKERAAIAYQKEKDTRGPVYAAKRFAIKVEVMKHYGVEGRSQCCFPGCTVCDIDMLTLDHIDNNGAADRKIRKNAGGVVWYAQLKRNKFPIGLQTLCANHNLKKEVVKQRNKNVNRHGTETHKAGPQSAAVAIII